jgi:mannose-6-phosphate isomerase-like protein (cupin superfamily)
MNVVDLSKTFASITTHWDPHIVAELNGQEVRCSKLKGEFIWHTHPDEDELFLVYRGTLQLRLRNSVITLHAGQFYVVPRGVEHQPYAEEEAEVVLFEPQLTPNTGDVRNELTKEKLSRI